MNCSLPGFPLLFYLLTFSPIRVCWVADAIQPSHPLLPLLLFPFIFPSLRVFSNESALCIRRPKNWTSASVLPVNFIQGWFPLGLTGLISLLSKALSRVFSSTPVQNISSSVLSLLYGPTLTSEHDHWKNHSFDYRDLSLLFNTQSRFVIAFLPRSKHLLRSSYDVLNPGPFFCTLINPFFRVHLYIHLSPFTVYLTDFDTCHTHYFAPLSSLFLFDHL